MDFNICDVIRCVTSQFLTCWLVTLFMLNSKFQISKFRFKKKETQTTIVQYLCADVVKKEINSDINHLGSNTELSICHALKDEALSLIVIVFINILSE